MNSGKNLLKQELEAFFIPFSSNISFCFKGFFPLPFAVGERDGKDKGHFPLLRIPVEFP
jgi:hypothetical protein